LSDPRFLTLAQRKENETELNQLIGTWTREHSAEHLMWRLQTRGVHAAKVNSIQNLFSDPQIALRNIWQTHGHPEMGDHTYRMVSYELSETPGSVRRAAPCLGADNEEVFRGWLGLTPREYEESLKQGAFS
jgi:crotonobetainyl-CoA:carnitine CoA-transferase CaiB-like acyl-CoA transferase